MHSKRNWTPFARTMYESKNTDTTNMKKTRKGFVKVENKVFPTLRKGTRLQDTRNKQVWKVVGIDGDEFGAEVELHLEHGTAEWIADGEELMERINKKEFSVL